MNYMMDIDKFWGGSLKISDSSTFSNLALSAFRYQAKYIPVYREFVRLSGVNPEQVNDLDKIPFLPVEFFKTQKIHDALREPSCVFRSSGTSGSSTSCHYVVDPVIYEQSFMEGFKRFYGNPSEWTILALLPGYLERGDSSLVYMMDRLIKASNSSESGFYLDQFGSLAFTLESLQNQGKRTLLVGVTHALVRFFEEYPIRIPKAVIMETGGMKGRGRELVREELHQKIMEVTGVASVHSEYGMTELLSQAYSQTHGLFHAPPWMKVCIKKIHDPKGPFVESITGLIHVIDLANIHSCSFIATKDMGRVFADGGFEVLGRLDESDLRGCNMLV